MSTSSPDTPAVAVSIVSHGHAAVLAPLLDQLAAFCPDVELILTMNIPEELTFDVQGRFRRAVVIRNETPRGFGSNHNAAFRHSSAPFFCVVNPDIRLVENPFGGLLECLREPSVGVTAPVVVDSSGVLQDSARPFPTPWILLLKALRLGTGRYSNQGEVSFPDWVAGMFVVFPRRVYKEVGGFDESYFLYYEDIDICARLRVLGYTVAVCREVTVIHDAQRASHRQWRYLRWHLQSIARFFSSPAYRKMRARSSSSGA